MEPAFNRVPYRRKFALRRWLPSFTVALSNCTYWLRTELLAQSSKPAVTNKILARIIPIAQKREGKINNALRASENINCLCVTNLLPAILQFSVMEEHIKDRVTRKIVRFFF